MTAAVWTARQPPPHLVAAAPVLVARVAPSAGPAQAVAGRLRVLASFVARVWLYTILWLAAWVLVPALALGWSPVVISSGSMSPVVQPGDVLVLAPVDQPLDVGRIVTFHGERGLVSHRVVEVMGDGSYRTRGDANAAADSDRVLPAEVHGAARIVVPVVGLPSRWMVEGHWRPLVVVAAVTGLAIAVAPLRPRRRPRPCGWRVAVEGGQLAALLVGLALVVPATSAAAWTGSTPTPATWTAEVLQAPTDVSTSYSCGILGLLSSITVEWTASTSTVDGYRILRSTDGGTLQMQADLVTGTSWTDSNVDSGKTYRYVVRSVAGSWVSADTGDNEATLTTGSLCL